jgi:hypothetical protein
MWMVVTGSIALLVAVVLLAVGGAAVWGLNHRDSSGYFSTGTETVTTSTYALASETLDMGPDPVAVLGKSVATLRLQARSAQPVFVGIGRADDVARYLARVRHTQVTDFDTDPFRLTSHTVAGASPPAPPASQRIWRVQASGTGMQTIRWPFEKGKWSAVVMNADGSANVAVALRIGARVPALQWVAIGLLAGGGLVLLLGGGLVYVGARRRRAAVAVA